MSRTNREHAIPPLPPPLYWFLASATAALPVAIAHADPPLSWILAAINAALGVFTAGSHPRPRVPR